ncbi:MAG: OmpH family outer membrane protein [Candidatus Dadabacteria bacterium]|nr:OmpH family outer membrane protein [Candidatus Dadabacteria bacterium]MCY4042658.1 OmpH family outer membrane protein [Candidatus Dadabacteria bacterium]MCY4046701.1 OmpH family outer membrane protein [Candidatus Dadabacteria bacterium]
MKRNISGFNFFSLPLAAAALIFSSFALCAPADAQQQGRVAIVDIQRVLLQSKAGKKARESFEKEFKKKQQILDEKSRRFERMEKELTKNLSVMNEDTLKQKSKELESTKKQLVREREDFSDDLRRNQEDMRLKFSKEIQNVVNEIGKAEGYSVILAKSGVLFVSDGVDITEKVIELHDRKY